MFLNNPLGLDSVQSKEEFVFALSSQGLLGHTNEAFPEQTWYKTIPIQVTRDPRAPVQVLFEYDGAMHSTIPPGDRPMLLILTETANHTGVLFVDHSNRCVNEYHAIDAEITNWEYVCLGYEVRHKSPGWAVIRNLTQGLPRLAAENPKWATDIILACNHPNWVASADSKGTILPARSEAGFCKVYAYLLSAWYHSFHSDDFTAYVTKHAKSILRKLFPDPSVIGRALCDNPDLDFSHPMVTMLAMTGLLHNACAIAATSVVKKDWTEVSLVEVAKRAGIDHRTKQFEHEIGDTETFVYLDDDDFAELAKRLKLDALQIDRLKEVKDSLVRDAKDARSTSLKVDSGPGGGAPAGPHHIL